MSQGRVSDAGTAVERAYRQKGLSLLVLGKGKVGGALLDLLAAQEDLSRLDCLKLDVEGYERAALASLSLRQLPPGPADPRSAGCRRSPRRTARHGSGSPRPR